MKGLPRPAAAAVHIAGVRTNFAMPDVHSIGVSLASPCTMTHPKPLFVAWPGQRVSLSKIDCHMPSFVQEKQKRHLLCAG